MKFKKRRQLLIEPEVQGSLMVRAILYWLACIATIEFLSLTWFIATGPEQPTFADYFINQHWGLAFVRMCASVLLLGPIIYDMLRLSNRFAGPVFRMQRVLRKVAAGEPIEHVKLRDNDYWHGFAADLNAALAKLAEQRQSNESSEESQLHEHSVAG